MINCPFAVYEYMCDKLDCDRACSIRVEAQRKEQEPSHHQTTILNPYHIREKRVK